MIRLACGLWGWVPGTNILDIIPWDDSLEPFSIRRSIAENKLKCIFRYSPYGMFGYIIGTFFLCGIRRTSVFLSFRLFFID